KVASMDLPFDAVRMVLIGIWVVLAIAVLVLGGFDVYRIGTAFRAFWHALRSRAFADRVQPLLVPVEEKKPAPPRPSGAPLRLLALLQREGRLLDFLLEDIQAYADADIGAAVRDIHRKCQAALKEHLILEPVVTQPEQATVDIPSGFDPSAVRLTGNVTGQPPF